MLPLRYSAPPSIPAGTSYSLMLPGTASTHASFPSSIPCPCPGCINVSLETSLVVGLGREAQGPSLALLPTSPVHDPGWGLPLWPPELAPEELKETPEQQGSLVALQDGEELLHNELMRAVTLP